MQVTRPGTSHHFPDQVRRKQSSGSRGDREMKIHAGLDMLPRAAD